MSDYALVNIDVASIDAKNLAQIWNADDELSKLGEAVHAGDDARAFPLDMVSLGVGFLISIAANVATNALTAGIKNLLSKAQSEDIFEVEVVQESSDNKSLTVKVTKKS